MKNLKRILNNQNGHGMVFPIELILGLATSAALVLCAVVWGITHLVRLAIRKLDGDNL